MVFAQIIIGLMYVVRLHGHCCQSGLEVYTLDTSNQYCQNNDPHICTSRRFVCVCATRRNFSLSGELTAVLAPRARDVQKFSIPAFKAHTRPLLNTFRNLVGCNYTRDHQYDIAKLGMYHTTDPRSRSVFKSHMLKSCRPR